MCPDMELKKQVTGKTHVHRKKKAHSLGPKDQERGSLVRQVILDNNCSLPIKHDRETCGPTPTRKGQVGRLDFHLHKLQWGALLPALPCPHRVTSPPNNGRMDFFTSALKLGIKIDHILDH